MQVNQQSASGTIIKAGLLAGTLDISCALLYYFIKTEKNPANVLRYVASGFFGKSALSGGTPMAAAGLIFHYFIAFIWTLFFFLIYPYIHRIIKSTIVAGLLYGIFVWLIMNLIVVPASSTPKPVFNLLNAAINMVILMLAIGLPISIIISKYYREKNVILT